MGVYNCCGNHRGNGRFGRFFETSKGVRSETLNHPKQTCCVLFFSHFNLYQFMGFMFIKFLFCYIYIYIHIFIISSPQRNLQVLETPQKKIPTRRWKKKHAISAKRSCRRADGWNPKQRSWPRRWAGGESLWSWWWGPVVVGMECFCAMTCKLLEVEKQFLFKTWDGMLIADSIFSWG